MSWPHWSLGLTVQTPLVASATQDVPVTASPSAAASNMSSQGLALSRSSSPSPDVSPSAALSTYLPLLRSASSTSSLTSGGSERSVSWHHGDTANDKRRGYMRPQATVFAESARNRDSVMSLGTIAHLQYYFARTGLLDGKGAQLAKDSKTSPPSSEGPKPTTLSLDNGKSSPNTLRALDDSGYASSGADLSESFFRDDASGPSASSSWEEPDVLSLPPTVSTYKQKQYYVQPPPNLTVLRRELREALEDAKKVVDELRVDQAENPDDSVSAAPGTLAHRKSASRQNWYEVQGLHVLDLVTLAIRAAKNYYTSHEKPQRLYAIQSERHIRLDLFAVLEVLKRVGARNFAGGYRKSELDRISGWLVAIDDLISKDEAAELAEQKRREQWAWLEDNWDGRERERERVFLESFNTTQTPYPHWPEPSPKDGGWNPFLSKFRDGVRLIKLHNEFVKNSRREFGAIKTFHTDTMKPYRCAENLRFWIKAAELRWDLKLHVDVHGLANDAPRFDVWRGFDEAIVMWCSSVRQELTVDWKQYREALLSERSSSLVKMNLTDDASTSPAE